MVVSLPVRHCHTRWTCMGFGEPMAAFPTRPWKGDEKVTLQGRGPKEGVQRRGYGDGSTCMATLPHCLTYCHGATMAFCSHCHGEAASPQARAVSGGVSHVSLPRAGKMRLARLGNRHQPILERIVQIMARGIITANGNVERSGACRPND